MTHASLRRFRLPLLFAGLFAPLAAWAAVPVQDLTAHWSGMAAVIVFIAAYVLVVAEEFTRLRKSQPVMLAAGVIWAMLAVAAARSGLSDALHEAVRDYLLEYAELLLFLLAAMTYVNAMSERRLFEALRVWLLRKGLGYRALFWTTGALAFGLSPIIDNLTTALVMCAVVLAVGRDSPRFVSLACINIVVAANAGGAFSPFGDITTLMVWQAGKVDFAEFFVLFLPSLANWAIPALCMHAAIPKGVPALADERVRLKRGAWPIVALFALTVALAVGFHQFLHLPPFLGMMTGLALLKLYGWRLTRFANAMQAEEFAREGAPGDVDAFDSYEQVARAEWDTLLFFFGVIMCVGALGYCGYLALLSHAFYGGLGATTANVLVGLLSAILDNIPMMVAVLQMAPQMDHGQWLLVTFTAGVGGSLLSIGSAAGVALMGQANGRYTFFSHLKWSWAIALGYAAGIGLHLLLNARHFTGVP
ncbi:sodium:proton antiporter [Pseudoluteimonas lycopersici]|uniref:Sodium:proton antiporter n=1 Tax=Pseudoluteimonas lycopersici TaxID=1324796 RepID=A0A516V787_9GAMM|nr:sodium:proton antiporter NhaD [Lysobacter lycopersici]QDQ74385.1 sodium:proton antiporter [Lysobacter lycopersici]